MSENPSRYELYAVYVQTITAAEQRRQQVSAVYTSLIAALLAVTVAIEGMECVIPVLILVLAIVWLLSIRYFRTLAQTKFEVIAALEKDWELKPFDLEYQTQAQIRKGFAHRIGTLTYIEMGPPVLAIAVSIVYIGYALFQLVAS